MATREQVRLFLHLIKMTAAVRFVFRDRTENLRTLALLGITREHAESLVLGLTPEDYSSGPSADHNHPGLDVWVFGLRVGSIEVYVKVQAIVNPPVGCVCISFHKSERPMDYPLRSNDPPANEEDRR